MYHVLRKNIIFLLITICLIASYSHTIHAPFVFDDAIYTGKTGLLRSSDTLVDVFRFFPSRFIPNSTLFLTYIVVGDSTLWYHVFNILLHGVCAYLVYQYIHRISAKAYTSVSMRSTLSLTVSLIFLVHPIQTEAVTYISQRGTIIVTIFMLLTSIHILSFSDIQNDKRWNIGLLLLFATGSFLSKETSYILPFLLVSYVIHFKSPQKWKDYVFPLLFVFMMSLGTFLLIIHSKFAGTQISGIHSLIQMASDKPTPYRSQYAITQVQVTAMYTQLLLWPVQQSVEYDIPLLSSIWDIPFSSIITHTLLLSAIILCWRKNRLASYGIVWYYLSLMIESSFLPLNDLAFEHRIYTPSIGIILAITDVIFSLSKHIDRRRFLSVYIPSFLTLLGILCLLSRKQNILWNTPTLLFSNAVHHAPKKWRPRYNLALTYERRADYHAAIDTYLQSISIDNTKQASWVNLANVYTITKQYSLAESIYKSQILQADAQYRKQFQANLGVLYMRMGDLEKAKKQFTELIHDNPSMPTAYYHLGVIESRLGNKKIAEQNFILAYRMSAKDPRLFLDIHTDIQQWSAIVP